MDLCRGAEWRSSGFDPKGPSFPEKDVFSSLKEVPDSYQCDWAGA